VTILEGPRMSGKTHTARKLWSHGVWDGYENLADPATAELARHDLAGWLESLSQSVIIDEAQLLADLPLRVKFLVDQAGSRRRFMLTGSASIGRAGLGGSDPLTGRAQRWTLAPLTAGELAGRAEGVRELVGRLFSGDITAGRADAAAAADWKARAETGGFPTLALGKMSTRAARRWVRDMTIGLLTERVLPDERFDAAAALRVLDGALRGSAGILNVTSLAQRLGMDPRSVDRYLDIMEERFLLRFLPNLATGPARQTRARSKVHPVDTAFAFESLSRAGQGAPLGPTVLERLLESYVVNQVTPAIQFAPQPVRAFYWRDAKTKREVDLVISDGEGALVGMEVKSASEVTLRDAAGLRALDQAMGLTRAYVVHPGTKAVRLADRCWSLPLSALSALSG
jgi:predicted AAA+ superfamily ATPase